MFWEPRRLTETTLEDPAYTLVADYTDLVGKLGWTPYWEELRPSLIPVMVPLNCLFHWKWTGYRRFISGVCHEAVHDYRQHLPITSKVDQEVLVPGCFDEFTHKNDSLSLYGEFGKIKSSSISFSTEIVVLKIWL